MIISESGTVLIVEYVPNTSCEDEHCLGAQTSGDSVEDDEGLKAPDAEAPKAYDLNPMFYIYLNHRP